MSPHNKKRLVRSAAALWTVMQVAACSSSTDPTPPVQTDRMQVSAVMNLVPGDTATLRGTHLDLLTRLTVDGRDVEFQSSHTEARFVTPVTRDCDTDGRSVSVRATSELVDRSVDGKLKIESSLKLRVGESQILSTEDLRCLQLSTGAEEYVLSVANHSVDHADWAGSEPQDAPREWTPADAFDDYANAKLHDVLTFVDWGIGGDEASRLFSTEKDSVPTHQGQVVGLAGNQMIVVRLGEEHTAEVIGRQATYQNAAEIADKYAVDAVRAIIDPEFTPPAGAGGRVITTVRDLFGYAGGIRTDDLTSGFRWASGMLTLGVRFQETDATVLAGTIVHEIAHGAETLLTQRSGDRKSDGWYAEALAVTTQDMAARLATGMGEQAPVWDALASPDAPRSYIASPHSGGAATRSTFERAGGYDRAARILRFAQETFGPGGEGELHRILRASGDFNIGAVANAVGMSVADLIDQSMLASITDDLVAAGHDHDLPQIRAWDSTARTEQQHQRAKPPTHTMHREARGTENVSAPAGGYMHWYIPASDHAHQGLSVEMAPDTSAPHQARLTRLR